MTELGEQATAELRRPQEPAPAQASGEPQPAIAPPPPRVAAPAPNPRSAPTTAGTIILVLSIAGALAVGFLAYEFWFSGLVQNRSQSSLLHEYKGSLLTADPNVAPAEGRPVGLMEISKLGVEQVVVQGIDSNDTKLGPGHDPSTPAPGQAGNVVIVCRRAAYGGPCSALGSLVKGNVITITTGQGQFTYVAQAAQTYTLGSLEPAVATTDSRLTLITSDPAYWARHELVVVFKLKGGKGLQAPGPLPLRPAGQKPGLSSGSVPWGWILLWGQLLLITIGLTVYLYRRGWSTAVAYLLTTPVLITLAVLFYESVDTLLPPTL